MYRLMTVIGPSVSMFRANETRLRMWLTVFALFAWRLPIGSAISTDHVSSLFFKKTIYKFCSNPIGKKMYIFIQIISFKYYILTPSLVISNLLLFISVVCSCCNLIVKGLTVFDPVLVGCHLLA